MKSQKEDFAYVKEHRQRSEIDLDNEIIEQSTLRTDRYLRILNTVTKPFEKPKIRQQHTSEL